MTEGLRAVLITGPGFQDEEVIYPYFRLKEEGVRVEVATSTDAAVTGKYGYTIAPTVKQQALAAADFDVVVIPGGHEAPDRVRQVPRVLDFVREMDQAGKLISSTCHGLWVLISAGIIRGRTATCYVGMKDDLINAGARYTETDVVVDGNIVTSDHPRNVGPWMRETVLALKEKQR